MAAVSADLLAAYHAPPATARLSPVMRTAAALLASRLPSALASRPGRALAAPAPVRPLTRRRAMASAAATAAGQAALVPTIIQAVVADHRNVSAMIQRCQKVGSGRGGGRSMGQLVTRPAARSQRWPCHHSLSPRRDFPLAPGINDHRALMQEGEGGGLFSETSCIPFSHVSSPKQNADRFLPLCFPCAAGGAAGRA